MWDFITKPLAWIAVILLALFFWWIILRLGFRAYFKSRLEYYQESQKRRKEDEQSK